MRSKFLVKTFVVCLLTLMFQNTFAQDKEVACKVLLEPISTEYIGKCKDGLAHGKGIASGTDVYEGKFKKGLPNGQGKYVWEDGSYYIGNWRKGKRSGKGTIYSPIADQAIKGIWKDDVFVKEFVDPPYDVTYKSGVTGVNFYENKTSTANRVEFVFQRDGSQSRSAGRLSLSSNSGDEKISSGFSGFENVDYPFEGVVEFHEPNRMGTVYIRYELKFKIIKAGSWKVVIRY